MNKAERREGERGIGIPSEKNFTLLERQNEDVDEKIRPWFLPPLHQFALFDLGPIAIAFSARPAAPCLNDVSATILGMKRIFGYSIRNDPPISLPFGIWVPYRSQGRVC